MARLEVEVGLSGTGRFRQGLDAMEARAKKWRRGIAGAFAGAFAVGSITAGLRTVMDHMDRIGKLSTTFQVAPEAMQRLGFAAEQTGSNLETVAKGLGNLTKATFEAEKGVKTYQEAFDDLGLSVEEMIDQDAEGRFLMLADAFKDAEDQGKALAALMRILGARGGRDLAVLLREGSDGIQNLGSQISTTSAESVRNIEKLNDTWNKWKTNLLGGLGEIVGKFSTALEDWDLKLKFTMKRAGVRLVGFSKEFALALAGDEEGAKDTARRTEQLVEMLTKSQNRLEAVRRQARELEEEQRQGGPRAETIGAGGTAGARGAAGGRVEDFDKLTGQRIVSADANLSRGGLPGRSFRLNFDSETADTALETMAGRQLGAVFNPTGGLVDKAINQDVVEGMGKVESEVKSGLDKVVSQLEELEGALRDSFEFDGLARFEGAQGGR